MSGLYEQVLTAASGEPVLPSRPPRASAAVVPWRETDGDLEVLWIRRASGQRFMGGWYAFPGGGVGRRDADLPLAGQPRGHDETDPTGALPVAMLDGIDLGPLIVPGLVAAALRELAEEVGWLIAGPELERAVENELIVRMREGVWLGELLVERDLRLEASSLTCAGRWLTPPLGPMRFDNRFFLLAAGDREADPSAREVEVAEWVRPVEALERWRSGEILAAPPVLHVLRVLAEMSPAGLGAPERLTSPVEANLGPFRRIEFQPGVLQLPLRTATLPPAGTTNCFVLGEAGRRVVIDPGSPFAEDQRRLLEVLAELPGGAEGVHEVWLTHQHPDHVGGVVALTDRLGVPVVAHHETGRLLEGAVRVDRQLEDGQQVRLGGSPEIAVTVLHTPGHAPGHLCFASTDNRWLIAGDMISGVSTIVIDPPEGNMADYFRSLERLAKLDSRVVLPAHGPPLLGGGRTFRRTLEHRRWREERIHAAWAAGERSAGALVRAAYDEDLPSFVLPLAERQVVAHLEHLGLDSAPQEDAADG